MTRSTGGEVTIVVVAVAVALEAEEVAVATGTLIRTIDVMAEEEANFGGANVSSLIGTRTGTRLNATERGCRS